VTVLALMTKYVPWGDLEDIISELQETTVDDGALPNLFVCVPNLERMSSGSKLNPATVSIYDAAISDGPILGAAAAFLKGLPFEAVVVVDEVGQITQFPFEWNDQLNLEHIESFIAEGQPRSAIKVARPVRRFLQARRGTFSSGLAEGLQGVILVCEYFDKCRTPVFADPGAVLWRRGIDTDIASFLNMQLDACEVILKSKHDLAEDVRPHKSFIGEGASLATVAFRRHGPKFDIFVWLSVYLLRLSHQRLSNNDTAEALALGVRALESYATYFLAESGFMYFESGAFHLRQSAERVRGTGVLWDEMVNRLWPATGEALSAEIAACREAIQLRNRGLFGHGVQKLTRETLSPYLAAMRRTLRGIELDSIDRGARWTALWQRSEPVVTSPVHRIIRKLLDEQLRFGCAA
jgi:hypothetical protein